MNFLILQLAIVFTQQPSLIYQFNRSSLSTDWRIVDDVVMGGRSSGNFEINKSGHGRFYGFVSLENYGGFSSVRHNLSEVTVNSDSKIDIRLKGDGKAYQFRVKDLKNARYSYITHFTTTGDWQTITIDLDDMYPSFRGRKLDMPNFDKYRIEEIAFLIANKKQESFELLIDRIELKI